MPQVARLLITAGAVLVPAGGVLFLVPGIPWLGKLPGDLQFQRGETEIFIPLATSLLLSAPASALHWIADWCRNKH